MARFVQVSFLDDVLVTGRTGDVIEEAFREHEDNTLVLDLELGILAGSRSDWKDKAGTLTGNYV